MSNYRSIWTDLRGHALQQRWIEAGVVRTQVLEAGEADARVFGAHRRDRRVAPGIHAGHAVFALAAMPCMRASG
jgi:hypothetical protein